MSLKPFKRTPITIAVTTAITMSLVSSTQAGQIVTDAPEGEALKTASNTPNKQFGFGGWDLNNVTVNVVSTDDFTTIRGSFDPTDGNYTTMVLGDSFESELITGGEVRGLLHGKDWPTGEPAGIKVINGDLETTQGKPDNCIMTTSYLDSGTPVLCSSDFQTHKRFKINLQPTTVADVASGLGKPVEISFKLKEGDSSTQRYQVLQKINNYTGKRLNGYKIEVLDATGEANSELTLSLGFGENTANSDDTETDIWDTDSMANFSHGLWGPIDKHFDTNGFFDDTRVYYTPTVSANTISYSGEMLGGNYQSLFGNWLPSVWEPTGVFHDEDMDPLTDATLKAFWGDPLKTGTNAWHKGNEDSWEIATESDLLTWSGDWYEQGAVEDVLNLGVNYIVNVGDNTAIGNKFTIRITPSIDADQVEPAYVADAAPEPSYDESEGIVIVDLTPIPEQPSTKVLGLAKKAGTEEPVFEDSALITVGVADNDLNTNPLAKETIEITVTSDHGETEKLVLTETNINTSRFIGYLYAHESDNAAVNNDGKFNLNKHTNLKATYVDHNYGGKTTPVTLESVLTIDVEEDIVVAPPTGAVGGTGNGGGGSFGAFLIMLFGSLSIRRFIFRREPDARK